MCDNPRCVGHHMSPDEIRRDARRKIKKHGWTVVGILDRHPAFVYTAGLTERRWPELCIEVHDKADMESLNGLTAVLNKVVQQLVDAGDRPADGLLLTVPYNDTITVTCCLTRRLDTRMLRLARDLYRNRALSLLEVEFIDTTEGAPA